MDLKLAEASVIGGLLMFPDETAHVFQEVIPDCFNSEMLREAFAVCLELHGSGSPIDAVTVASRLSRDGNRIVAKCCEVMPTLANFGDYVAIVRDGWRKRTMNAALFEAMTACQSPTMSASEIVGQLSAEVERQTEIERTITGENAKSFAGAFEEFCAKLKEPDTSLKTGWNDFDWMLGGFVRGGVYAVSARSGSGKTDFLINLAMKLSRDFAVVYCSLEMTREQLMIRIVSRTTRINNRRIRDKKLTEDEHREISRVSEILGEHTKLTLDDSENVGADDVAAKIIRYKPDVIVLDHLGIMKHPQRRQQWEGIAETTRQIKNLAKRHNIVIMEAVQMNRETDKRKGAPVMADLRGGGSVEADADGVFTIVSEKSEDEEPYRKAKITLLKNRHGEIGELNFNYYPQHSLFVPVDERREGDRPF